MQMNLTAVGKSSYGSGVTCIKLKVTHFSMKGLSENCLSGKLLETLLVPIITVIITKIS